MIILLLLSESQPLAGISIFTIIYAHYLYTIYIYSKCLRVLLNCDKICLYCIIFIIPSKCDRGKGKSFKLRSRSLNTSNRIYQLVMFFVLAAVSVAIVVASVFLLNEQSSTIEGEMLRSLKEISEQASYRVDGRMENTRQRMLSYASAYCQMDDIANDPKDYVLDPDHAGKAYIQERVKNDGLEEAGIKFISVMDMDGNGEWFSKAETGNFSVNKEKYYERAKKGNVVISRLMDSHFGDKGKCVSVLVPIYDTILGEETITGVLVATLPLENLQSLLDVQSFGGSGYVQVIDYEGDIVVNSLNSNANIGPGYNVFDELRGQTNLTTQEVNDFVDEVANGKTSSIYYTLDGENKLMYYLPLKVANEWYMLSVVPTEVLTASTSELITTSFMVIAAIVILFLAIAIAMIFMQVRSSKRLSVLAYVDPVTTGFNRNRFEHDYNNVVPKAAGNTYAMVSIDIDKFKLINDMFGADSGDRVLSFMHKVILENLRPTEFVARLNADNFCILVENGDPQELEKRFDKITEEINNTELGSKERYIIKFSVGVFAINNPSIDMIAALDFANTARQKINESERHEYMSLSYFSTEERQRLLREKEIDNRKEDALKNGEFVVYYQPKYDIKARKPAGAEALVRWKDPIRGMIPPGDFIGAFEQSGFILQLDLYVFGQVCRMLRQHISEGIKPVPISVNMSVLVLEFPDMLENYAHVFRNYDIDPSLIEIEFTETMVFKDMKALLSIIGRIHELGFKCSLDDFGSGYSSLNLLKDIPVDTLKMDRGFFTSGADERSKYVISSVIQLAKGLNMHTVAEGVETMSQVNILDKYDCDLVQGYVFSRPIPEDDFRRLLIDSYGVSDGGKDKK